MLKHGGLLIAAAMLLAAATITALGTMSASQSPHDAPELRAPVEPPHQPVSGREEERGTSDAY